ncbi:MAG: sugar ABC transporter permease [Oscillospiraceae bacterium]|nr:sugar ABC transporter permease [Oscillospiraceae bacterium]
MEKVKNFLSKNAMLVILILVMFLFEALMSVNGKGSLFSSENLSNLIGQNSYVVILATGMLLCILTGGNIDLSVGSIVILVGAICGVLIVDMKVDPYVSILLCLIISTLLGAWQAFWISYFQIPAFVTTLSGMLVFRGLALVIMGSKGIGPYPEAYKNLFNSFISSAGSEAAFTQTLSVAIAVALCAALVAITIFSRVQKKRKGYAVEHLVPMIVRLVIICGVLLFVFQRLGGYRGIPVMLAILGVIVLFYSYFTLNTVPGRYLYAMGGNEKAARLSGVNTKKMLFFAYTNMGFLSGIAALVCVARFNQASTTAGTGFELDAIGACYIGGASAYGGVGTVSGAVIGAIFVGVLNMGMSILGADQNLQRVIKGLVLLAAVIFDVLSKNRKQEA